MTEIEYEMVGPEALAGGPGHGLAPPLSLDAAELRRAERDGLDYTAAETRRAAELGAEHGLSADHVRVATAAGIPLTRYVRLSRVRNIRDWESAEREAALQEQAEERARLELAVEAAKRT